eukprot:6984696-Lingulodinium_polyedra.AAC.1
MAASVSAETRSLCEQQPRPSPRIVGRIQPLCPPPRSFHGPFHELPAKFPGRGRLRGGTEHAPRWWFSGGRTREYETQDPRFPFVDYERAAPAGPLLIWLKCHRR